MQKTDLNVSPYFDDYSKEKGFHRILFQPRTVQTRELNQMQAILQNQIESLSGHIFKEGGNVIGGEIGITQMENSLGMTLLTGTLSQIKTTFANKELYVQHQTSGAQVHVAQMADAEGDLPLTMVGNTVDGTNSGDNITFSSGDNVNLLRIDENGTAVRMGTAAINRIGTATIANCEKGIFFIRGFMVESLEQTAFVDRFNANVSARVGMTVTESIVTSAQDSTLLSNATGQPNHRAPGADRLKIELKLDSKPLEGSFDDFFESKRIELGRLINPKDNTTEYNELGHLLAKRQFETNGNYTVQAHSMDLREHLLDANNGGVYLPTDGGDESKFVSVIQPGISYVSGYRVENEEPVLLTINKARDTATLNNVVGGVQWDGYFQIKASKTAGQSTFKGSPVVNTGEAYSLYAGNTQIGSAVASAAIWENNILKLYMHRIVMNSGRKTSQVTKIRLVSGGTTKFEGDIAKQGYTTANGLTLMFPLPVQGVKAITDASYTMIKSYEFTANASGVGSVNAGSGLQFSPETSRYIVGYGRTSSGGLINNATLTLGGGVTGTTLTVNAGSNAANEVIRVVALVINNNPRVRTKTLMTRTDTMTFSNQSIRNLMKYDMVELVSVKNGSNRDVTSQFGWRTGQRTTHYLSSQIHTKNWKRINGTFRITYRYLSHSAEGDYFAPESYNNIPSRYIKPYRDDSGAVFDPMQCIDFRREYNLWTSPNTLVMPNSSFRSDIEYYLGRVDTIYLSKDGEFGVKNGVPGMNPVQPEVPDNAMPLFDLIIPPFTNDIDSIQINTHTYKRYRMEDIQKLEDRIENVEYYTTMSQLEASAENTQVIDATTGLNRFKNGIFADPFTDFRLLDPEDQEYSGSIDLSGEQDTGAFRPETIQNGVDMVWDGQTSNVENRDDMIGPRAVRTENSTRQPYATDWINVNPYEAFSWAGNLKLNPSRDFWWDTKWLKPRVVNKTVDQRGGLRAGVYYGSWQRMHTGFWGWRRRWNERIGWWQNSRWWHGRTEEKRTVTTVTETSSTSKSSSTKTLGTQVIPYMRKIRIRFSVSGMRPNTYVWPYFSNRMIQAYCQQDGRNRGATLRTDGNGALAGYFYVPNDNTMRFNTGKATFVLVDNKTNPNDPKKRTTFASANFESGGTLVTKQTTHTYTRYLGASKRTSIEYRRVDPVAQSFVVSKPGGEMIDGVEIFFRTKSRNIPVTLEIRGMENGLPTHEVLERKMLNPGSVKTSSNGLTPTYFKFDKPLYLESEKEYAIVIIANTVDYHVYYAQLGRKVIHTGYALAKQPNTGVMFTSANGSTWTAHQNRDLKFTIKRNVYTTGTYNVIFKAAEQPPTIPLDDNCFESVAGQSSVRIHIPGHALRTGDTIIVAGAVGDNNIATNSLNKTHTITSVNDRYVVVSTGQTANASGHFGGDQITGKYRYGISQLFVNVESVARPGTTINWKYRVLNHTSRTKSSWQRFTPKSNVALQALGSFYNTSDFEIAAECKTSRSNLIPQIDLHGFTALHNSFVISKTEQINNAVTQDIFFTNPSTSLKLFIGSTLPTGSNMRVYVKLLGGESGGESGTEPEWQELQPTSPIINSTIPVEQKYDLSVDQDNAFSGIKVKIALTGDRVNPPMINDMRGIALA
ncbi:hypothetical protein [Vibrio phage VP-1]|uniref:DUF4815 domain-containing protein n=1 Tax=Vibrio phage VP-1 TaxID=2234088 RepID=A0A4P2TH85_9CAUD|nr:hypothetical protein [Vibrio phage VP-1]